MQELDLGIMMNCVVSPKCTARRRGAFAILRGVLFLMIVTTLSMWASDAPAVAGVPEKSPSLPVGTTFGKVVSGENKGLYELKVANNSGEPLTVNVTVHVSVPVHNQQKVRKLPPHVIEAGKDWKIEALAARDVVMVVAAGFAPLKVTVP